MSRETITSSSTKKWLLLVDLDGTLWDHPDISQVVPPFKKLDPHTIMDSNNTVVQLHKDTLEIVRWAKNNNAITSTLSWNHPDIAVQVLRVFGVHKLFDYLMIEPHPNKDEMIKKLLDTIRKKQKITFNTNEIVYIDDRTIHLEQIRKNIGNIIFLQRNKDYRSPEEAIKIIREKLNKGIQ